MIFTMSQITLPFTEQIMSCLRHYKRIDVFCFPTYLQWFIVSIIIKWSEQSSPGVTEIGMDNFDVCKIEQPNTYYLDDYNTLIAVAKSIDHLSASHVRQCLIRVQPQDMSKSQILRIVFESFYITSCDVKLTIEESSFQSFKEDVSVLSKLSCKDLSPVTLTTSKDGNGLQVNLTRIHSLRDFNFRLNITTLKTSDKQNGGLSLGEKIGIGVICSVAGIIALILIYKTIRLRISVNKEKQKQEMLQLQEQQTAGNGQQTAGNVPSVMVYSQPQEDDEHMQVTIVHANDDVSSLSEHLPEEHDTSATPGDNANHNERVIYPDSPPSYDEALSMPLPGRSGCESPEYQNLPASNSDRENGDNLRSTSQYRNI